MKKFKKVMLFAVAAGAALSLVACSSSSSTGNSKTANKKPSELKIGVSISDTSNPYFASMQKAIAAYASSKGVSSSNIKITDAQHDSAKENANVQNFISAGDDAILIDPVDSDSVVAIIKKANKANIPVVLMDNNANGGDRLTFVASDNVQAGSLAAQAIKAGAGSSAKTLELQGTPGASSGIDRGNGFEKEAKTLGLNIVAKQSANFDRAKGLSVTQDLLQANSGVQAIYAQNDEMALGAVQAVKAAGLKNVVIVGVDGEADSRAAVKAGDMYATVAQQPNKIGELALQAVFDHYAGKTVPSITHSPIVVLKKNNVNTAGINW